MFNLLYNIYHICYAVSSKYIWSKNSGPESEAKGEDAVIGLDLESGYKDYI
jgi:hypothetical protein